MHRSRSCLTLVFAILLTAIAIAQTPPAPQPAPDVAGTWSGTWSAYNPAQPGSQPKEQCKSLTAKVSPGQGGVWEAIFEGDCGRPYKYTIKMEGRQVGKVVMFKGTVDLGPKDGGVFDWIGRATDKEFVGFYTSGYYTGVFTLTKSTPQ
ncbi:MAG TPA: hypothetical protein VH740_25170 [Vicinamibacterales bacterium]